MKHLTITLLTLLILNGCSESIEDGPFEHNWPSGNLMERGTYVNEKVEGLYEFFFDNRNGQIAQRAYMKEGQCEGSLEYFYLNGSLKVSHECENGEIQNTSKFYYSDGSLNCLAQFKDSKEDGPQECYFQNGDLRSQGNILKGHNEGVQEYFDPQGNLFLKEVWQNKMLLKAQHFNQKGKKIINGTVRLRHNNSRPYTKALIKDGHTQGNIFTYYEDGSIESHANYVNSRLDGMFKRFHLNGQLGYTSEYKNGLRNGITTQYALDGTILWQGEYKEGELVEN